ncbi:hypothetical protein AAFF_G00113750 [Aldrovandia affinis]|uniref:Uncharacterized protein n=1 Tax=Aldrovandia affinis TaxID=143900 RepID=A0AAD7WAG5_9TELE|nr:hypothetical protein AAFF_G00113750 [Aldrovandia affinis]
MSLWRVFDAVAPYGFLKLCDVAPGRGASGTRGSSEAVSEAVLGRPTCLRDSCPCRGTPSVGTLGHPPPECLPAHNPPLLLQGRQHRGEGGSNARNTRMGTGSENERCSFNTIGKQRNRGVTKLNKTDRAPGATLLIVPSTPSPPPPPLPGLQYPFLSVVRMS